MIGVGVKSFHPFYMRSPLGRTPDGYKIKDT